MKTRNKELEKQLYETPWADVIEIKQESLICASKVKSGSSVNDWLDGGTTQDELVI